MLDGHVVIEAEDEDEAIHIAEQQTRLSEIDADYRAGSFKVDYDTTRVSNLIKNLREVEDE